ncbi:MAG: manganese efflux pump MntP family protein [Bacteroidota bacterium]
MGLFELLLIGLGLSMDCFAVAISTSICQKCLNNNDFLKVSLSFGIFQGGMPIIGWLLGFNFRNLISEYDHWISFIILLAIGAKMIFESLRNKSAESTYNIKKPLVLLSLSIATSIDALVIGVSLAFLNVNILNAATSFTIITFVVSLTGLYIGKHTRKFIFGKNAEIIGGLVLVGLAIKILNEHIGFISSLWQ